MELHCLGTTGYHPNDRRHTACYVVPEAGLVFDAGTGIFRLAGRIQTDTLDLFLSHAHTDHVIGLTFLFDVLYQRPVKRLRIWGEIEKLDAVRRHLFSEHLFPIQLDAQWCPITVGEEIPVGLSGRLRSFPLVHPGGSVGYRIDWPGGHSIAYVTDTVGDCQGAYVREIRGCNLLIHECYFRDSAQDWAVKTGHTWTSRAAEVARAAGVGQLLLIHINPLETGDDPVDIARARGIFPATTVAEDEMIVEF